MLYEVITVLVNDFRGDVPVDDLAEETVFLTHEIPLFDQATSVERMRQRPAVHVFEFTAERNAVRDPARLDIMPFGQVGEIVRGRVALDRRIGGDDHFTDAAFP